ncbi:MAG: Lacal_2735 family protein [Saprospiraceae bacterium]|nr:Lacal_2735 family protein [Saprospiraceae bacterium]
MFGLFKKKDPIAELKKAAARLEEEAFQLSRTDRKAADLKTAEAAALWQKIEALQKD